MALLLFRASALVFALAATYALWRVARKIVSEWLPLGTPLLVLVVVAWAAIALATLDALAPSIAARPARAARALAKVLVAALLILIVVEVGLRVFEPRGAVSYLVWTPRMLARFHPAPEVFSGIPYAESRFSTNARGLRGRDPAPGDRIHVLVVGGSTAEELYVDDPDAWPQVIEETLRAAGVRGAWVENAGKSGLDTAHHVVLLRTLVPELRPDLTVALVGINDLALAMRGDFRGIDWDYGAQQFYAARAPLLADGALQPTGLRTYWALRRVAALLPWTGATELVQDETGRNYLPYRERRQRAAKVDELPADFDHGVRAYEQRLRELVRAARATGTRLVLLTQPSLLKPTMDGRESATLVFGRRYYDDKYFYSTAALVRMLAAYNAATLRICAGEAIACLDLEPLVPKDLEHFYDDVHFNTGGSRLVGRLVGAFLARDVLRVSAP